ncbi:MAG: YraN family protein [Microbacteriaceae bacterium]|nr:YraN family protein [Burkholderiaceae bacterium]
MFKGWSWGWGRGGGGDRRGGGGGDHRHGLRSVGIDQAGGLPVTKVVGDAAEDRALAHLQQQGLRLICRNYRLAGGPRQRGAEIDLIMTAADGTLVFVEVRARRDSRHGGAAASVSGVKQRRLVHAAQHYLMGLASVPPCRFDVVAVDGDVLTWLPAAFDA